MNGHGAYRHYSKLENIGPIVERGLEAGLEPDGLKGVEWALAFYDDSPVFLTLPNSPFIEAFLECTWSDYGFVEVDTAGLELVADLPSLVDLGAKYSDGMLLVKGCAALRSLLEFADRDGWIEIEHLTDPRSHACAAAVEITGTAACLGSIPAERISPPPAPKPIAGRIAGMR